MTRAPTAQGGAEPFEFEQSSFTGGPGGPGANQDQRSLHTRVSQVRICGYRAPRVLKLVGACRCAAPCARAAAAHSRCVRRLDRVNPCVRRLCARIVAAWFSWW